MAELVDAQVSGTCDRYGRGSSSLLQGTITKRDPNGSFFVMVDRVYREQRKRQQPKRTCKLFDRSVVVEHFLSAKLT